MNSIYAHLTFMWVYKLVMKSQCLEVEWLEQRVYAFENLRLCKIILQNGCAYITINHQQWMPCEVPFLNMVYLHNKEWKTIGI